jgi:glycogen synthase
MLSWEYPPLLIGGLGRHVDALARELVRAGHDVCVVTRGDKQHGTDEPVDGVRVVRAAIDPLAIDFTTESLLAWAQASEHALLRAALPVLPAWAPDVVHAHDWLVAQSSITLAELTGAPLVATIHATEFGRNQGWLPTPLNRAIHSVEGWLAHRADAVITCSSTMSTEVRDVFELPPERVTVVPNGVDLTAWRTTATRRAAARARVAPDGPLLVFVGRLVHEKGLQTLLAALPALRGRHPGLQLVVAGSGGHETSLRDQAAQLRITRAVQWAGFVDEDTLARLIGAADVAVVPSLYEPFGLVALEAAAARTALVVADTGGLRDLIEAGIPAASFPPGDHRALGRAVTEVLDDPVAARSAISRASRRIRRDYTWPAVSRRTAEIYARAGGSSAAIRNSVTEAKNGPAAR